MPLPEAWRFRDYVINAFDRDQPLDETIREHLAGDLLPHQSLDEEFQHLVATGFLVLGPHNYENQDKELLDLEIIDEQLDTMGRAFLGMTIGCARCHDHKFDPIPTHDYYAMAGIFAGQVRESFQCIPMEHPQKVTDSRAEFGNCPVEKNRDRASSEDRKASEPASIILR